MPRLNRHHPPATARARLTLALSFLALASHTAHAQTGPSLPDASEAGRPLPTWTYGDVSQADRQAASQLFKDGKKLLQEQADYQGALSKFEQAAKRWDHPALRGYLASVYNAMGQPRKAYIHVQAALRYGPPPLGTTPEKQQRRHTQLKNLERILTLQLVRVRASTLEPDIDVAIAGTSLATQPDSDEQFALPGENLVTGFKDGFIALNQTVDLPAGESVTMQFYSEHPYPRWLPWLIVGIGGASTVAGGGVYLWARSQRNDLAGTVAANCQSATPSGCDASNPEHQDVYQDVFRRIDEDWPGIRTRGRVGLGALIVGGVTLLSGAGMAWWNTRRYLRVRRESGQQLSLVPSFSRDQVGVLGVLDF